MKENSILHPKNKIVLFSLGVWLQSLALFIVCLFVSSYVANKYPPSSQVFNFLIIGDVVIGIIAFMVMGVSLMMKIFGKRILLLFPILLLVIAYFILIFPRTQKVEVKQSTTAQINILLSKDLKVGSTGEDVIVLQSAFTANNLLTKNLITGYFGTQTKNAVILFQKDNNILQTGEVDNNTRNKFNEVFGKIYSRHYYVALFPTAIPVVQTTQNNTNNNDGKWGVAEREAGTQYGWSMNVGNDSTMGSAQEVFDALNNYRSKKGTHGLNWDGNLASYAQERAVFFQANGLDDHSGFKNYISNADNRKRLGFFGLGENASTGYRMTGTHIIEWIFASDQPHDLNQLNPSWTDVGIGVSGTSVEIIFGYDRF